VRPGFQDACVLDFHSHPQSPRPAHTGFLTGGAAKARREGGRTWGRGVGSGVFAITAASALFVANARSASVAGKFVLPFVSSTCCCDVLDNISAACLRIFH